ncbi:MAG TPA: hypothetical protein VHZ76_05540 [Gammaproteobacteria bacterium]|jgi:hypothetical protein|nr:hypothetical protein [Gammaproteobacteria bacterium]
MHDKNGRPTTYSIEIATEICDTVSSSTKGIKRLCLENDHWPCPDTIFRWLKSNKDFSDQYARAKRLQIEALVDEILEIADDSNNDYMADVKGKMIIDHEHIQRAKLRIDTRKWLASKLVPKIYGNRIQTDLTVDDSDLKRARELVQKYMAEKNVP